MTFQGSSEMLGGYISLRCQRKARWAITSEQPFERSKCRPIRSEKPYLSMMVRAYDNPTSIMTTMRAM